jgi:hypothetical protein
VVILDRGSWRAIGRRSAAATRRVMLAMAARAQDPNLIERHKLGFYGVVVRNVMALELLSGATEDACVAIPLERSLA